ncbi:MAPEG family protein [Nevskia sp.]|uniref:MAPEG family protein n=1 Tax=Nevskia sp. TaxID=1929292 RepID=UPI0025F6397A|nr:MAPEG family protein [Nevskia sp.]
MSGFEAVLLYVCVVIVLVLMYALPRVPQVLTGSKPANAWGRDQPSIDPALLVRAQHAHANAVENFPLFLAVVVVGALMNKSADVIDPLAIYVVYLRIGQAVVHLIGTSFWLVMARATLFLSQIALIVVMAYRLLHG